MVRNLPSITAPVTMRMIMAVTLRVSTRDATNPCPGELPSDQTEYDGKKSPSRTRLSGSIRTGIEPQHYESEEHNHFECAGNGFNFFQDRRPLTAGSQLGSDRTHDVHGEAETK